MKKNTRPVLHREGALPPLSERLRAALREDLGAAGDITSEALVPLGSVVQGVVLAKADGVVCGVQLLSQIFHLTEEAVRVSGVRRPGRVQVRVLKHDGQRVKRGEVVARLRGSARVLLAGERLALNLLCHLSGVATQTARFVARVRQAHARILDTRKTTPLWRDLEKYAVRCGGGSNHRAGLHDMLLIKDNHLALWGARDPAGAVNAARARFPGVPLEVEVTTLEGLRQVCTRSRPDFVLLDNFTVAGLRAAVKWRENFFSGRKKNQRVPELEASGGVTLESLTAIAETGVERISIGALTHSVPALDLSLELKIKKSFS